LQELKKAGTTRTHLVWQKPRLLGSSVSSGNKWVIARSMRRCEGWIEDQGPKYTLITNPCLVQTGLDLVSFYTVVFYEPENSLYTRWQALR
jgi:hypothetical protein